MGKKLCEMTLEELWMLFPIFLCEHKECWSEWFSDEFSDLTAVLPQDAQVNHIGSTAIAAIWAKPIVDILAEVARDELCAANTAILACGYTCMCAKDERFDYCKGYTENGFAERVFHLHLRVSGDNDELYFRDYLNAHSEIAKEYESLKLSLWKKYEHDRDGYTDAKGEFVRKWTHEAKAEAV